MDSQGILATSASVKTMEEAKALVEELNSVTPSDEVIERCMNEGILEKNDKGEWVKRDETNK